jgi:3-hydroxybutyryl-CoA dehydrogenase
MQSAAGTMGAQVAAGAGHPVIFYDAQPDAVSTAIQGIRQNFQKLASKGKISGDSTQSAAEGLRAASTLETFVEHPSSSRREKGTPGQRGII